MGRRFSKVNAPTGIRSLNFLEKSLGASKTKMGLVSQALFALAQTARIMESEDSMDAPTGIRSRTSCGFYDSSSRQTPGLIEPKGSICPHRDLNPGLRRSPNFQSFQIETRVMFALREQRI